MVSHGQPNLSLTFPGTAHAEMSSTSEDFKELIGLTSLILRLLTLDFTFVDTSKDKPNHFILMQLRDRVSVDLDMIGVVVILLLNKHQVETTGRRQTDLED